MNEEAIHKKWKKIVRGITLEDAIRCEGYHQDLDNGDLSASEVRELIYQMSLKYS
tara:strand:- start:576 stop:740 length:165 start_codon:yes stop_codon:yes gene_type:complete